VFDPFTPLLNSGPLGILAACTLAGLVVLWRREARTLDLERAENAELRQEIKDLNTELRVYLAQQKSQQPRTERLINEAIDIVKEAP
jgi:hypothetical protein